MRIYDSQNDKTIENITLYLTIDEARELHHDLSDLIERPIGNHAHVMSNDYQRELTVCVYDKDNLAMFDEKSKKVIME
jgi:hypothetical protein